MNACAPIGAYCVGAWGLEPPLGNAASGLSPSENREKEYFLVVQIKKPKISIQH